MMVAVSSQQKESLQRVAVTNCEGKLEEFMVVGAGASRIHVGLGKLTLWGSDFLISLNLVEGSDIR